MMYSYYDDKIQSRWFLAPDVCWIWVKDTNRLVAIRPYAMPVTYTKATNVNLRGLIRSIWTAKEIVP